MKYSIYLKKAFTLIEILVVIAIIGILLSVVVPSLSKAKIYAEEIVCKNNLYQYLLATEMYCNDHNDMLPCAWTSLYSQKDFVGESERHCRWHNPEFNLQANADKRDLSGHVYAGPYWPYLAVSKAHVCPVFAKLSKRYGENHPFHDGSLNRFEPQFSYSMNGIFDLKEGGRRTLIKKPFHTFLWAEENMWTLDNLSSYVLNDNALLVGESSLIDCFGSYHKISKSRLATQQSTHTYESGVGLSNVLLFDGSVKYLTPEDSISYMGSID
jgi:prepilin-type N-terminal cleavage/methylation domain-containing protein